MCDVLDKIEEKGRLEGRLEGKAQLIKNAYESGLSKEEIKRILKVTDEDLKKAVKLDFTQERNEKYGK